MKLRRIEFALVIAIWLPLTVGCATLPNTEFLSDRFVAQSAQFDSAWGRLSAKRSTAIVDELKRTSGDIDILDKQIALEQAIVGSPLVVGNSVTLLQDGPTTYEAMFTAIGAATQRVDVESYIIEDDEVGTKFADLLIDRRSNGVQVNVIYDSVGALSTPKPFFDRLTAAGVQLVEFNPINPLDLKKAWAVNNRDHRKLLIVDGRIAFVGGINISSVYSTGSSVRGSDAPDDPTRGWRDTDIRIGGPVVAEFEKLFDETWEKQHGPPLPQRDGAAAAPVGKEIVRAIGSTPDDAYSQIYLTLISAITNAQLQVYLINAYFVPDPQLMKALLDAAARQVDVRLILPSHSDSGPAFYAGRRHYTELLKAGVKIYERQGALLHAKTAVVDGVWSCVGSSNLDWRSALDNNEINAVILGREFAQQMHAAYAADIAASKQIDLATWNRRPLSMRAKELFSGLWARLL